MIRQSTQKATDKGWVFLVLASVILCQTPNCVVAQTTNTENNKIESSIANADNEPGMKEKATQARTPPPYASVFRPREVGDDELVEKRSELEDRLRRELLACSPKGAFQELINSPWNEQTIEQFGELVIPENNSLSLPSANERQWASIMNLLAFIATSRRDQAVGQKAAEEFDRALAWASTKPDYHHCWHYCMYAIETYGSVDLFTPIFWNAYEKKRLQCGSALRAVADAKVLARLRATQDPKDFDYRRDNILFIEERLKNPKSGQEKGIGFALRNANIPVPQNRYKAE